MCILEPCVALVCALTMGSPYLAGQGGTSSQALCKEFIRHGHKSVVTIMSVLSVACFSGDFQNLYYRVQTEVLETELV